MSAPVPVSGDTREEESDGDSGRRDLIHNADLPDHPPVEVSGDTEPARCSECGFPPQARIHHGYPEHLAHEYQSSAPASDDGTPTDPPRCDVCQGEHDPRACWYLWCHRDKGAATHHDFGLDFSHQFAFVPAPEPEGTARVLNNNFDGCPFCPHPDHWGEACRFKGQMSGVPVNCTCSTTTPDPDATIEAESDNREGTPGLSEARSKVIEARDSIGDWEFNHELAQFEAAIRAPIEAELQRVRSYHAGCDDLINSYERRNREVEEQLQQAREALRETSRLARKYEGRTSWMQIEFETLAEIAERALATPLEGVGE